MKVLALAALASGLLVLPATQAAAHSAGPLDINGCHSNNRLHDYHCHLGDYRGKHFESKADMLEMKRTGEDTSIEARHSGRLDDLVGTFEGDNESSGTTQAPATAGEQVASQQPGAHSHAPARSVEDRMAALKRLYERDLITKAEYDAKRRELLDEL